MPTRTPLHPGEAGPGRRAVHAVRQAAAAQPEDLSALCGPWFQLPEALKTPARHGHFSRLCTFWLFVVQVLSPDGSCAAAVARFATGRAHRDEPEVSSNTAAYCKARARLPLDALEALYAQTGQAVEVRARREDLWCDRRVRVADGSSCSMPDTPENQALYPQPRGQKEGCGFPVMRLVGLFSLATGALVALARGPLSEGEGTLLHRVWDVLARGDVLLTDRGLSSFAHVARLLARGVDAVMRQQPCLKASLRPLKRLGKGDRLMRWTKPAARPSWMTRQEWKALPPELTVRQVTVHVDVPGFRSKEIRVLTTLLDPKRYPASALAELYRRRWQVELFLRDLKGALGLDVLRGKSPGMVHRELAVKALAYNLVRGLMLEAAHAHSRPIRRLSFQTSLHLLRPMLDLGVLGDLEAETRERVRTRLLKALARTPLPKRKQPDRHEPRVRKRRPKNYPLLNKARTQYQEIPHRNRYKKAQTQG